MDRRRDALLSSYVWPLLRFYIWTPGWNFNSSRMKSFTIWLPLIIWCLSAILLLKSSNYFYSLCCWCRCSWCCWWPPPALPKPSIVLLNSSRDILVKLMTDLSVVWTCGVAACTLWCTWPVADFSGLHRLASRWPWTKNFSNFVYVGFMGVDDLLNKSINGSVLYFLKGNVYYY